MAEKASKTYVRAPNGDLYGIDDLDRIFRVPNEPECQGTHTAELTASSYHTMPDGVGASITPDGVGASITPDGVGASITPDGVGASITPDGVGASITPDA